MEENQDLQQKYSTFVAFVEEQDDTYEILIFVESVSEKKQMLENYLGWENQVGSFLIKV